MSTDPATPTTDQAPKRRSPKRQPLTLAQAYASPKITPSVHRRILELEDFSTLQSEYCTKVCGLCTKPGVFPDASLQVTGECDVAIVQDFTAMNGKFDKWPGQQEQKIQSIAFNLAREAGMQGLRVRVFTLVKCPTAEEMLVNKKMPTNTRLLKCAPYLWQELRESKPKVLVSTSTLASRALGLKASNKNDRGKVLPSQYGPVVVSQHARILTYIRQTAVNASSGYWSADFYGVLLRDLVKASRIARGQLPLVTLDQGIKNALRAHIRVCRGIDDVRRYTAEILALPQSHLVSWDIETTGFSGWVKDAKVLCMQFAYRKPQDEAYTSVVIPLWHRRNTAYNPDEAWTLVKPILEGPTKKCGWNVKFDRVYTAACTGVLARNIVMDGLLAYHMMDSGINGCYSLKSAVTDFMPESGLAGYEDRLPKLLTKMPDEDPTGDDENEEDTTE